MAKQIVYSNQEGKTQREREREREIEKKKPRKNRISSTEVQEQKKKNRIDGWMARIVQFKTNEKNVQANLNLLPPLSHQFDKSSQR